MQPDLFGDPPADKQVADNTTRLRSQLVRLGDMLGDGLGDEPGGAWIRKEYKSTLRALGYTIPRANNADSINKSVATFLAKTNCPCGGRLVQTRSGAKKAVCIVCSAKYVLK
ncbi:hypothetical protein [Pseudomonas viridiflava]|uniref:hypothetical protein n=1 Tax=Pseudomonas viridiflava TaxID=33069 RepID=UPI001981C5D4|nr:hypothetical protein [Pseudomonas viridiflava]